MSLIHHHLTGTHHAVGPWSPRQDVVRDSSGRSARRRASRSAWPLVALFLAFGALALTGALGAVGLRGAEGKAAPSSDENIDETVDETPPPPLTAEERDWLALVAPLITDEERDFFLSLRESYQRDAFAQKFWEVRDPDPTTRLNELEVVWKERAEEARLEFGDISDIRSIFFLLNGQPGRIAAPDGRPLSVCYDATRTVEAWFYGGSERTSRNFVVIFHKEGQLRPYEIWLPGDQLHGISRGSLATRDVSKICRDLLPWAMGLILQDPQYPAFLQELINIPEPPSEWVATFASFTTNVPPDAETFGLGLDFEFLGRRQSRTVVQGIITVPQDVLGTATAPSPEASSSADDEGSPTHYLLLTGAVVRDDRLFESFRYRFEIDAETIRQSSEGLVPLLFQRYLRPGPARIILKIEDLTTQQFARFDREIEVPSQDHAVPSFTAEESEFLAQFREANEASRDTASIRIVPPMKGDIQVGATRFATITEGDIDAVTFFLDDEPLLTKRRPPYSVELNLGSVVSTHILRVEAMDSSGDAVASDELAVNQGGQRFRIRLVEPRPDKKYRESLVARADVEIPDGAVLDRVELFLNERRLATLYQEPFEQPILLTGTGELAYVRAVAYLDDGNSTEDVVFVNAPDLLEEVDVQYVELYANVVDEQGRPILGLERDDFSVFEDGVKQSVRRFEWVESLPIHAGLLIDTSASMEDSLETVTEAARAFAEQIIQPKDRIGIVSFASQPQVELRFSNSVPEVAQALARLHAEGGTALYDSLVFSLNYFHGIKGQRALLLLSDGKDESSRFDFDTTLEIARRAGVQIYVIGLKEAADDRGARKVLRQLAEETGGRAFFLVDLAGLPVIYRTIQEELRSQYLLAYQSTSTKDPAQFRRIEVKLVDKNGEVRTMAGYYP